MWMLAMFICSYCKGLHTTSARPNPGVHFQGSSTVGRRASRDCLAREPSRGWGWVTVLATGSCWYFRFRREIADETRYIIQGSLSPNLSGPLLGRKSPDLAGTSLSRLFKLSNRNSANFDRVHFRKKMRWIWSLAPFPIPRVVTRLLRARFKRESGNTKAALNNKGHYDVWWFSVQLLLSETWKVPFNGNTHGLILIEESYIIHNIFIRKVY